LLWRNTRSTKTTLYAKPAPSWRHLPTKKTDRISVVRFAIGPFGSIGVAAAGETTDKPSRNKKMTDIVQSTREFSIEMSDESTLEVAISVAISTENPNSIASVKLDNLLLSFAVDSVNKAIVDLINSDDLSDDDKIELESIGPDQEDGE
jgi:hypothetical protein